MEDVIKTTPDRERAKSLVEMASVRLDSISVMEQADPKKFTSKVVEEYYETILELITAIMCLDGYKTRSDAAGAHIASISYMRNYRELKGHEMGLLDDLRKKRIGIKYYGRHVDNDYLQRNEKDIKNLIGKLKSIIKQKLT